MYILALRQYCHALNIPKVLNIAATFFSHKGYDLSDYSLCIPSPTKCTSYARNLSFSANAIYSAVQLFCGQFKGNGSNLPLFDCSINSILSQYFSLKY